MGPKLPMCIKISVFLVERQQEPILSTKRVPTNKDS